MYSQLSELKVVNGRTTETASTEERGGWKRVKTGAGVVRSSASPRRRCRLASGDCDLTVVTFWTSLPRNA